MKYYYNLKAEFSASFLQSSVSRDSSEIILICWFVAQETFLIIINENSCAGQYFCGNCETFYFSGFFDSLSLLINLMHPYWKKKVWFKKKKKKPIERSCTFSPFSQVEKLARTLFLWKIEVHEQKEKVYEMRRWNEALVTNMLPEHVARHFLGSKKRDEVRNPACQSQIPCLTQILSNSINFPCTRPRSSTASPTTRLESCSPPSQTSLISIRRKASTTAALSVWGSSMKSFLILIA